MYALCLLLLTGVNGGLDDAKGVMEKLKGAWQIKDIVSDGFKVPQERLKAARIEFDGNKMTMSGLQGAQTMTFKLNPSTKPAQIDFRPPNVNEGQPGIYELDGDDLKIAFPGGDGKRPTDFKGQNKQGVFVLKRMK